VLDVEPLILSECEAISACDSFAGSDWQDVLGRAGLGTETRRWFRLALVAVCLFGIAAPAFALRHQVINFFTASRSPNEVIDDFGRLEVSSLPGYAPGVLPHQARVITTIRSGGTTSATLSVAPTRKGGYCDVWKLHGLAPVTATGVECLQGRTANALGTFSYSAVNPPDGVDSVFGSILRPEMSVRLRYADGTSTAINYVWVSKPINAGFFYYRIAPTHGSRPTSLVVSAHGHVVSTRSIDDVSKDMQVVDYRDRWGQDIQTTPEALWGHRHLLLAFNERDGTLVELWVMPSRRGSNRRCFVANPIAWGCIPAILTGDPLQLQIIPGAPSGTALLFGEVAANVRTLTLHYRDGATETRSPHDGFLLIALPPRHYSTRQRLDRVVATDEHGKPFFTQTFSTNTPGVYPCTTQRNYGYGVKRCP
jgi:hypothetical protein